MKIKVIDVTGYVGFENVRLPFIVEAHLFSDDLQTFFVSQEEMAKVEGCEILEDDVWEGCDYVFFSWDVEVIEE